MSEGENKCNFFGGEENSFGGMKTSIALDSVQFEHEYLFDFRVHLKSAVDIASYQLIRTLAVDLKSMGACVLIQTNLIGILQVIISLNCITHHFYIV